MQLNFQKFKYFFFFLQPIQHSSPYQSFNKTDSIKLANDSDIFFDMDGFDCQVGENIGSLDDSIDDDEDDSTFGK